MFGFGGINGSGLKGRDLTKTRKKKKSSAQLKKPKQKEKTLKGATLHYFIERGQQLVCSAALGQMIEAADKIECQRADGHGETERGEQRSLVK